MSREMKNSGVPWIGEIPNTWEIRKVKDVFVRKNEKAHQDNPVILSLARAGVKVRDVSTNEGQMAESYYDYNPVEPFDLLVNPMDLYSGANCSMSLVSGVISPAYVNLRAKGGASSRFYDYYFKTQYWSMAFFAHGKGISFDNRWTLGVDTLFRYNVPFPSVLEQQKIASFLDRKCAEIDEMIALQEKIVEELKAYKQSVITEAVTKGLNPDVTMKDSGIEWVGEIPEHWRITTIGRLFRVSAGGDAKWDIYSDKQDNEHPFPVYTNTLDKNQTYAYTSIPVYKGDTITVTGRGDIGRAFYRKTPFDAIIRLLVLEKRYSLDCRYFAYFINNVIHFFTNSAAIGQLSAVQVVPYNVCHPSIEEQTDIADYLDTKCTDIDNLILLKLSKIDSLKEYKKSIIYEYVTGKKEVI